MSDFIATLYLFYSHDLLTLVGFRSFHRFSCSESHICSHTMRLTKTKKDFSLVIFTLKYSSRRLMLSILNRQIAINVWEIT